MSSLGAGLAIGLAGDAGVRALGQQDRIFVGMMLILINAEALGIYRMIISLILAQKMVSHFITKRNKLTINFNLNESHYFK